jgi:hypothetical protein
MQPRRTEGVDKDVHVITKDILSLCKYDVSTHLSL